MRTQVILACVCAIAYVRAQNSLEEISDGVGSFENIYSLNSESDLGDASQYNGVTYSNEDAYTSTTANYGVDYTTPGRRGRYQALADQYNEQSAPRGVSSTTCQEKNERYSIPGSCDRYIECLNGTAEEKQCPDGLRYNANVKFNVYPCQYPIDVPCVGRSALQPAQPTADCPHQFGYFKTGDARNCSGFRNCVNGVGYEFTCPEGLAFSSETYRCEWPDQVEDCDAEAFLGFRCPEVPISKELGPPAGFRHYRSSADCQTYFICIEGRPRRLACGGYSAFDEDTASCVSADEVSACPTDLRDRAARSRKEEKQRLTAETAFERLRSPLAYLSQETYGSTTQDPEQFDDIETHTQNYE